MSISPPFVARVLSRYRNTHWQADLVEAHIRAGDVMPRAKHWSPCAR